MSKTKHEFKSNTQTDIRDKRPEISDTEAAADPEPGRAGKPYPEDAGTITSIPESGQNGTEKDYTDCFYDKQTRNWFRVSHEKYIKYKQFYDRTRKYEQYHGRCSCPPCKWWLCDAACLDCEFHKEENPLSLDTPMTNDDGNSFMLIEQICDDVRPFDDIICTAEELHRLFEKLGELMPEAFDIGLLRQEGLSDESIASTIGIYRTTFRSRLEKAKKELAKETTDLF